MARYAARWLGWPSVEKGRTNSPMVEVRAQCSGSAWSTWARAYEATTAEATTGAASRARVLAGGPQSARVAK